jgi:hypothetical protein
MGWWANGEVNEHELWWGDEPADVMSEAVFKIIVAFMRDVGRMPSITDIVEGIKFTTNALTDTRGLAVNPGETSVLTPEQIEMVQAEGSTATGSDKGVSKERRLAARRISDLIDTLTGRKDERPMLKAVVERPEIGPDLQD